MPAAKSPSRRLTPNTDSMAPLWTAARRHDARSPPALHSYMVARRGACTRLQGATRSCM